MVSYSCGHGTDIVRHLHARSASHCFPPCSGKRIKLASYQTLVHEGVRLWLVTVGANQETTCRWGVFHWSKLLQRLRHHFLRLDSAFEQTAHKASCERIWCGRWHVASSEVPPRLWQVWDLRVNSLPGHSLSLHPLYSISSQACWVMQKLISASLALSCIFTLHMHAHLLTKSNTCMWVQTHFEGGRKQA